MSAKALADELSQHIAALIARRCICGDVVLDNGAEADWALEGDWTLEEKKDPGDERPRILGG